MKLRQRSGAENKAKLGRMEGMKGIKIILVVGVKRMILSTAGIAGRK